MNRIHAIALIGIAVFAFAVILTTEGCGSTTPQIGIDEECKYRTIVFDWKHPDQPGECEIYAHPPELDDVQECDMVVFYNQTDKDITIVFEKNATGKLSPFLNTTSVSLEPNGNPNQFSKGLPVAIELADPDKFEDFPYHVELDKEPQTEQSPRIRIGPRSAVFR